MTPFDLLYAHGFASQVADAFAPKRRNPVRTNSLLIGEGNKKEILKLLDSMGLEVGHGFGMAGGRGGTGEYDYFDLLEDDDETGKYKIAQYRGSKNGKFVALFPVYRKTRRNVMRRNPLWPTPTPTVYRTGRLGINNNPLFPAVTPVMGRAGRLNSSPPTRNPRKKKAKRKSTFVAAYIRRHTPKGRKLTPKQRGKLLAAAMAAKRGKRKVAKRKNPYTPKLSYKKYSRKPTAKRYYSKKSYRRYSATPSNGLVKIYNKTDQIFASGSVNSGKGYGVKKSDKFTHKFSSKPSIYGVPKSGRYNLPAGAIVIKGAKKLFKQFGSKSPSFRSSRRLRSRSSYRRSLR